MVFPLALMMRAVYPILPFRIGSLRSNIIGHYVFDIECYLASQRNIKRHTYDLFFLGSEPSVNLQWEKMVRRTVWVRRWYRYLWLASFWVPGGAANRISFVSLSRDRLGVLQSTEPQFSFMPEEERMGRDYMTRLGMLPTEKYVCLIVRDAAYKVAYSESFGLRKDWSYHNYRDTEISDYRTAIDALIKAGYWVFRMGKNVEKKLVHESAMVIDYANSADRSDFLDIWLAANCSFCVSTCTGLDEVARAFRRPAVYVNFLPLRNMVTYTPSVNAPKRLFWTSSGQELTLTEHLKASYLSSSEYDQSGISIKDLDPQEIELAVKEMITREKGHWVENIEMRDRQVKFWDLMNSGPDWGDYHGVVAPDVYLSDSFLKKNMGWLS